MRVSFYVPPVFPDPRERSVWFTPDDPVWPDDWPIPQVGDVVYAPVTGITERDNYPLYVAYISWYPTPDPEEDGKPYVHITLRQERRFS